MMDFFARQDHARRQTVKLLVLFALAVLVIIVAIYVVVILALNGVGDAHGRFPARKRATGTRRCCWASPWPRAWWFRWPAPYKVSELAGGGEVVAQMVGGRLIDPQTRDPAERRLLNVVEEMSIASGVSVPPVYVLDHEPSINAFAAGYQPNQAVVTVSRGCLEYLTRDELQGVLGHEFSHILNGDMRLNLRLIGLVYGILVLSIIGYYIMRSVGWSGSSRSRSDRESDGQGAGDLSRRSGGVHSGLYRRAVGQHHQGGHFAAAGVFGRRLQRAVHPQLGRPGRALKKIGGLAEGSRIRAPKPTKSATCSSATRLPARSSISLPRTRRWTSGSSCSIRASTEPIRRRSQCRRRPT